MAGIATESVAEKTRALVEPIVARDGYELVEVEWVREGRSWVLRLFIDKAGEAGRVGIEDCQAVSRTVETLLDVEGFIEPAYSLEVSSPGLERPLRKPQDFERFKGQKAALRTYAPLDVGEKVPRKNWSGKLEGFSEGNVEIEVDGKHYKVPLDKIAKAHLEFDFDAAVKQHKE